MKKVKLFSLVALCLFIFSCDKDDDPTPTKQFRVTIENVFEGKDYFQSGAFGAIPPGESLSFSLEEAKDTIYNLLRCTFRRMIFLSALMIPV